MQPHNGVGGVLDGDGLLAFDHGRAGGERACLVVAPEHAPKAVASWSPPAAVISYNTGSVHCLLKNGARKGQAENLLGRVLHSDNDSGLDHVSATPYV